MADGRRSKVALASLPADEEWYWENEWELYVVVGGFEHVAEPRYRRLEQLVAETNKHGKVRMREIHLAAQAAGIELREGEQHTRAGRDIEAGQLVGYLPCDLYGESEHPCGGVRYRMRLEQIGNVFMDSQSFTNISVGQGESVSNLWFARV